MGRGAIRRVEILVARNTWRGRVRPAESRYAASASGARHQFGCHMHGLTSRRIGNHDDCVCLRTVMQWADGSYFGIIGAGRLVISGLAAVGAGAILWVAIGARRFVDVEVIIR